MTPPDTRRLLVFARAPRPGKVKTRLAAVVGAEAAAAIYRQLLAGTLEAAARVPHVRAEMWCDASDGGCELLASRFGMTLHRQQGQDLGSRMQHALGTALKKARRAVLVGSDCPDMTARYIGMAFAALEDHDAVLGPAADGGYVLIGLRDARHLMFQDIPWSTDRVLGLTRSRMAALHWRWAELPTLRDLDRPSDLAQFPQFSGWSRNLP